MRRAFFILGLFVLGAGCTESATVLGPGEDTTQSLIINFGGTRQSQYPDSRSVFFVSNASVRQPVRAVTVSDVRFSTIIDEATCEAVAYTAVALNNIPLSRTTNAPSETCSTTERYTLHRRNAPFYGTVRFQAAYPRVITPIDADVSLLSPNAIINVQALQVINAAEDLMLHFQRPVDPAFSTLYLYEATLGEPEILTVRFTEPDDRAVIPSDQLARLRSLSKGIAFTIHLQETRVDEDVIPIRDPTGSLLTFIDVWNTNTYTVEVIMP